MKREREESIERDVIISRKRLHSTKRENLTSLAEVERIDREIATLVKKRKEASLSHMIHTIGPLEAAICSYSQACTLALVARLQADLPRELRDIIYAFLIQLDECLNQSLRQILSRIADHKCLGAGTPCDCILLRSESSFLDRAYVGFQAVREIVEAFYRLPPDNSGSHVRSPFLAKRVSAVGHLVCDDIFRVGRDSGSMLRHMNICLMVDSDLTHSSHWHLNPRNVLPLLLSIVHKAGFVLTIELSKSQLDICTQQLEFALDILRPILRVFCDEGAIVDIYFRHDESESEWDLNSAIKESESRWRSELMAFLGEASDEASLEYTIINFFSS